MRLSANPFAATVFEIHGGAVWDKGAKGHGDAGTIAPLLHRRVHPSQNPPVSPSFLSVAFFLLLALSLSGCSTNLVDSARLYEEKGDYNMAISYYEKAAALESRQIKRMVIYTQLSSLYARVGQFDAAQANLENVLTITSELSEEVVRQTLSEANADYCLALNALKEGNYKRCIGLLESMKTDDAPDVHYYLSIAYRRQAENYFQGKSVPTFQDLTTSSPEFHDAIALINQGRELASRGNTEEAGAKFELALEQVSEDSSAQNDYEEALLLLKRREYTKATRLLLEMSETADVSYYLGLAYQEQARISAQIAIQWLEAEKKKESQGDISALYENALKAVKDN